MNDTRGGDSERIAPIIPLFGKKASSTDAPSRLAPPADDTDRAKETDHAEKVVPRRTGDSGLWRSAWDTANSNGAEDSGDAGTPSERHPARGAAARAAASAQAASEPSTTERSASKSIAPRLRALRGTQDEGVDAEQGPSREELRAVAEEALLRKLRSKSLSISEARLVLRGHHLDSSQIDDVIDDFCRRSYLDDAVLAELLVSSGVERKGQGRVALSRALSLRGIPRDVIDAALDDLPDDDSERALEFARSKAQSMSRLDNDTAVRRLIGQLSRRGYNGSVAMNAAKTALREVATGGRSSGVRFVDSD
ncbi:regulatory protein RecX [Microbacterium sp. W4I20]|uniref:regulatory protein RecX n=1 Tax=Microbacterium sp. W4I20 TaxID=3042262 RepID=UPI00277F5A89|nr:regulatory protein RecX [Microbacterium sp. W4I20]MDQ0725717.1 regulatory protein [Microbacterium sp. W4I20]